MELFNNQFSKFPTSYSEIIQRIRNIDPIRYSKTRNYINGAVSYLSPYISRGVVSTKFIFTEIINRGYNPEKIEKFIQELAWRDYWQQIWIAKGNAINHDLKHQQYPVSNNSLSSVILKGETGINAIDTAIKEFYKTGYIHNHVRMYIASITCNIAQSHWKIPAKWMYYYLLDADWASNALSWQWVAGANAHKKYIANQDNINKYCFTNQKNTFLDFSYEALSQIEIPEILKETSLIKLETPLPKQQAIDFNEQVPTLIYNFYNIDPNWKKNIDANRVLLMEPSIFSKYPIAQNTIDFVISLSKKNIPNIQLFVGEFHELQNNYNHQKIIFKEHPLNYNYNGIQESRDWIFSVKGYHSSFFSFWKKCKKEVMVLMKQYR